MDPLLLRLQVAQELVNQLVVALSQSVHPTRAVVQAMLDQATAKIKVIENQTAAPPLVAPVFTPATS